MRNSEAAPVLCGGRSSPVRDAVVLAVLKEDGQFLEGLVSGPGADGQYSRESVMVGGGALATSPGAYCVCRSSRLASLSVCWAPTCPHAAAVDGRDKGAASVRGHRLWGGRDVKHTHRSPPWKRCEEGGRCRGQETGDGSEARRTIDRQWAVLLALVTEGEGLVLTGPLLAVIGDWGRERRRIRRPLTLRTHTNVTFNPSSTGFFVRPDTLK